MSDINLSNQIETIIVDILQSTIYDGHQKIINYTHKKVHEGRLNKIIRFVESLADDGQINILFRTGDNEFHFIPEFQNVGTASLLIYRSPTLTDPANPGTALPIYNLNDSNPITPAFTAFHTPSLSDIGTLINPDYGIAAATVQSKNVGQLSPGEEIVFKPNTDYLLRLTNISGGVSAASSLKIEGYEELD